jgi:hypothetical protein
VRLPRPLRPPLRRARRSLALRWLAVAAGAALVAVESASVGAAARAERDRWGEAVPVAVALAPLGPGDVIGAGDVAVELRPLAVVPDGALTTAPLGRTVVADVLAGEVLVEARAPASGLVPAGWVAIAVPTSPAPPLEPGDRVDVLAPDVVAEDAVVVHVDDDAVTIAVPERDAPAVAEAATVAFVVLALKPNG